MTFLSDISSVFAFPAKNNNAQGEKVKKLNKKDQNRRYS
jgi:hypothetical protein